MSEKKEKVSHFSKPISEITIEEIEVMSKEDLNEYIMESPVRMKEGMSVDEYDRELVEYLDYKHVLPWAKRLLSSIQNVE
jgi:hypothetical protein